MPPENGHVFKPSSEPYLAASAHRAPAFDLRPLSVGEILDRTFAIYRSHFALFAGISAVSGSVQLIADALNLPLHHAVMRQHGFRAGLIESQIGAIIVLLLFGLATAVTEAATVFALSRIYLGHRVSIAESLRATAGRWYRYAAIAAWQGWSAVWLGLLLALPAIAIVAMHRSTSYWLSATLMFLSIFAGSIFGAISYLRNSLAVPASVIEHLPLRASMRRSKVLSPGAKGRAFVVLLVTGCLFLVAGVVQSPLLFLIARAPRQEHTLAEMVILAVSFAAHTLVAPVALLGLSLLYFDQRVRHEGLDLLMLLGGANGGNSVEEWATPQSTASLPQDPGRGSPEDASAIPYPYESRLTPAPHELPSVSTPETPSLTTPPISASPIRAVGFTSSPASPEEPRTSRPGGSDEAV